MKITKLIIAFLFGSNLLAQSDNVNSDLRIRVDSIIKYRIEYKIDSTTNKLTDRNWNPSVKRGLYPGFSSFPDNPMTLIILDSKAIALNDLNNYKLSEVEISKIYKKDSKIAISIYGTSAKNGLIILRTKNN